MRHSWRHSWLPTGGHSTLLLAMVIGCLAGGAVSVAVHSIPSSAVVGLLTTAWIVVPRHRPDGVAALPEPRAATIPSPRPAAAPDPVPDQVRTLEPTGQTSLDPLGLLSSYVLEETAGYQPDFTPATDRVDAPPLPALAARVPGQTMVATGPDTLAAAFAAPLPPVATGDAGDAGVAWRAGMDILPSSRRGARSAGSRMGSFRAAVLRARRDAGDPPAGQRPPQG